METPTTVVEAASPIGGCAAAAAGAGDGDGDGGGGVR